MTGTLGISSLFVIKRVITFVFRSSVGRTSDGWLPEARLVFGRSSPTISVPLLEGIVSSGTGRTGVVFITTLDGDDMNFGCRQTETG